jgi:alkanesulfonate monooxygenase SsuD/methylene tetrahydromethanopterin reductase-like flavin-dependent oxidoreductase (luciferase family)
MGATPMTGVYGVNDQVDAMLKAGGAKALEEGMPEDWLDWLSVVGTPEEAATAIGKLFDAGSTSVVLCLTASEDLPEQLAFIGREVLPRI